MKAVVLAIAILSAPVASVGAAPTVPSTPAPIEAVLYARAFTLERPYRFRWRREAPQIRTGYLLVLAVDPRLVRPRQSAQPVLYAGDQTAERVNRGQASGRVVVIVPGATDLSEIPIWFGGAELPERVEAETIEHQRRLAEQAGIGPRPRDEIAAALARGGKPLRVRDIQSLLEDHVAPLILEYSPDEEPLALGLRD